MQLLIGTLIDTPNLGSLRVRREHLVGAQSRPVTRSIPTYIYLPFRTHTTGTDQDGFINHLQPLTHPSSVSLLGTKPPHEVIYLEPHSFLLPSFTDLHLHAPQYLYAGTGLDLPLMEWLDRYAYRAEERIDQDEELARRVYTTLVKRLVEVGTGCVVLFGTIGVEANLILAKAFLDAGIRAFVGKLSMDQSPRTTYGETSVSESLDSLHTFLGAMDALTSPLPIHRRIVQPIITPRFVPVCSDELLRGLARVSEDTGLRVQSHMCEGREQMEWVEKQRGKKDEVVFDQVGLLKQGTIQAHVTSLPAQLIELCEARGVTAAHCPLSNAYFSDARFPLREALDAGMSVGLGSDISGGYSLSIQSAMRHAVIISRTREGQRRELKTSSGNKNLRVDWIESLYLATRGGKKAVGMGGKFEVGLEFDAQMIQLVGKDSPLDFFDLPIEEAKDDAWWTEAVERWWCNGDERNRKGLWVQGRRVR